MYPSQSIGLDFPFAALGIGAVIFFFLFIFAIIIGIYIAIVYAVIHAIRKYDDPLPSIDPRSGTGKVSDVPQEVKKWNWAAAFIPMVWGIYHNSWLFLLNYVPGVNLFWWIVMGLKGNEWAWKNNQWQNVERFTRAQLRWRPVGIVYFIFHLLMIPYLIFVFSMTFFTAFKTMDAPRYSPSFFDQRYGGEDYLKEYDYELNSSSTNFLPNDESDYMWE